MSKKLFVWMLAVLLLASINYNVYLYRQSKKSPPAVNKTVLTTQSKPEIALPEPPEIATLVVNRTRTEVIDDSDGKYAKTRVTAEIIGLRGNQLSLSPKEITVSDANSSIESASCYCDGIEIIGRFPIETQFQITLPKGLPLADGGKTNAPLTFAVEKIVVKPAMSFTESGPYYPAKHKNGVISSLPLQMEVVNVPEIHIVLWHSEDKNMNISDELIDTWSQTLEKQLLLKVAEMQFAGNTKTNVKETVTLDIAEMAKDLKPGVYFVQALNIEPKKIRHCDALNYYYKYYVKEASGILAETSIIISDLAISTTISEGSKTVSISVLSLTDLSPVANTTVALYSLKRQTIASGTTGKDGTIILKFSPDYLPEDNPPLTVVAKKGADTNLLRLKHEITSSDFENYGNTFGTQQAFIYTERGIYRPGEKVHCSFVIKQRNEGGLSSSAMPFIVNILEPRGISIYKTQLTTNENGVASTEFSLPKDASNGIYTIVCGIGDTQWNSHSFLVGSFIPDRFKVTFKPEKQTVAPTDSIPFLLDAVFYFGMPVENAKFETELNAEPIKAPHWKDYAVGTEYDFMHIKTIESEKYPSIAQYKDKPLVFKSLDVQKYYANRQPLPAKLVGTASVTANDGGQTVSSNGSLVCLPLPYYVGLKQLEPANGIAQFEIRMLKWDAKDETPIPPAEVKLTLSHMAWNYKKVKRDERVFYEWTLEEVSRNDLPTETVTNGIAKIRVPSATSGRYELIAECNGLTTELPFYFWYGEAGNTHSENPNILFASTDKERYLPGETVKIKFNASEAGSIIAVLGEQGIAKTMTQSVEKGENTIELQIPQSIESGNAFVHLTLASLYKDNYRRSFGFLKIPVDQSNHRLALTMEVQDTAVPGEEIPIIIKAHDAAGAPQAATVQLMLVDEGILSLTNYMTPDIFSFFYGNYYCDFKTFDFFNSVYSRIHDDQKAGGGGSDAKRYEKLKMQKNAIVVLPPMDLGEEGMIRTTVKLPDHTGQMRVMLVASTNKNVGSYESTIKLHDHISALPSLPVAVAENDEFDATFTLVNHDATESSGTIDFDATGFEQKTPRIQNIVVAKGHTGTAAFRLKALKNGAYTLPYTMTLGEQKIQGKCIVNVRSIIPYTTKTDLAIIKSGETLIIKPKDNWQTLDACNVSLAPSPVLVVPEALKWLGEYPYGCLEQTTSCAFPYLCVGNLIKAGIIPQDSQAIADRMLKAATVKLLGMQVGNAGFKGWPDYDSVWEDASIYAAHFILQANPAALSEKNRKYIHEFLWRMRTRSNTANTTKAYTLYIQSLDKNQKNDESIKNLLNEQTLSPLATFLAAAALYNSGYAKEALPYLNKALDERAWQDFNDLPWILNSDSTLTGLVLSIAVEMVPQHPACNQMAFALNRQIKRSDKVWGSTRDNAWASIGLAAFAAKHDNGVTKAEIDGSATEVKETISCELKEKATIKNTGDAELFVRTVASGIPKKLETEKNAAISITKKYLDAEGNPVAKVKHGDLITVLIEMTPDENCDNAVLLDLLPGGFQIEDATIATRTQNLTAQKVTDGFSKPQITRQENRQDRYLLFASLGKGNKYAIAYSLRAVTPGTFAIPPTRVEDMYDSDISGSFSTEGNLAIEP